MQNDQNMEGMAVLFVIAIVWFIFQILFAIFLAVGIILVSVITLMCLIAWNKPLHFFGEVLTPQEARAFILGGVACALAAMFVMALAETLGLPFPLTGRFYAFIALCAYGYGGASCLEFAEKLQNERAVRELLARQETLPPVVPPPYVPPFEFADWQDEEEFRR